MSEKLILLAAFVFSMLLMSISQVKKRKKVVFFGGLVKNREVEPRGYILHILQLLKEAGVEDNFELVHCLPRTNKVNDILRQIEEDILAKGADIVILHIVETDNEPASKETHESQFKTVYQAVIKKLEAAVIKIALCTPPVVAEKKGSSNEFDIRSDCYSKIIRDLAVQHDLPLVDLRKAFLDYVGLNNLPNKEFESLTKDNSQLSNNGNRLVAEEMWKVLQEAKL